MKKLLFCLLVFCAHFGGRAQTYYNEWIDHNKTYYKFKVGANGLYRIPASTLSAAGLITADAAHFQLWRHGQQVPLYTSVASGPLGATDYIEFWGEMNDGKPDKPLYRSQFGDNFQLNDKWNLHTDTAVYFLTVNTNASTNKRLATTPNNVVGNNLPAEPYFMHTVGTWYRSRLNAGYAVNVGEFLYSSSYDKGEGFSSNDIGAGQSVSFNFNNLNYYNGGVPASIAVNVSGNAINPRRYRVSINSDSVWGNNVDFFNYDKGSATFTNGNLSSNTASVQITNQGIVGGDRMAVHKFELTYPRTFNFGGASSFEFQLPANAAGNYLEIAGFNGGAAPVLYDLTNGQRYTPVVGGTGLQVVLQPSATERRLLMVNTDAAFVSNISSLTPRTFINYKLPPQQSDYLIVSHPALANGPNGTNPLEEYRAYRSSVAGGSYNAKLFFIEDLVDQFAYGIKMHPLAIKNFVDFAAVHFATPPKHLFLIGRGVTYSVQRTFENNPDLWRMHFVPTWGAPASDVLFTADVNSAVPKVPVGRLSVINGSEVAVYLKKVRDHEAAQQAASPTISDKAWTKNVVHIVGASEPGLQRILDDYMTVYKRQIEDTLFGAKVYTFTKSSAEAVEQINNGLLDRLFADGITLMTYFGHSSAGTLEFNLNNPDQYNNTGKYPLFIALGCNAGNFFTFTGQRLTNKETLSEKYVLAQDKGTIGFIASSHFGIVHYLDIYNYRTYQTLTTTKYGATIGEIMLEGIKETMNFTGPDDFYARAQSEESILHGDPAITLNPHPKPDYVIEPALLKTPATASVADPSFPVQAKFLNLGKAISKNISVTVTREYPNRVSEIIFKDTIPGIRFTDSLTFDVPIDPLRDKGANKITVTIDADEVVAELFENNNSVTKEIIIIEDEARPVFPYNYSIVGKQGIKLIASTANPLSVTKTYRMEMDTTEHFNSPLKSGSVLTAPGGILEFSPTITFTDSTVYYWRIGTVVNGTVATWNTSSFVYIPAKQGFNQSHVHQHQRSLKQDLSLDTAMRNWEFNYNSHSVFARNGIFPTAANQEADFTVAVDGDPYIRSACVGRSLLFNVFDYKTFVPWRNVDANGNSLFRFGSGSASCAPGRQNNFEFSYMSTASRKAIMDFMDTIPENSYVVVRSFDHNVNGYASTWMSDTALHGSGNSLYHKLKAVGFTDVDSINRPRAWILIYQKGAKNIQPKFVLSQGVLDKITLNSETFAPTLEGLVSSPLVGPAKSWQSFYWSGKALEASGDQPLASIVGVKQNGAADTLYRNIDPAQPVVDVSGTDAKQYPYLKLVMHNKDTVHATPYQLAKWGVYYTPVPEGSVAPNLLFTPLKDTIEAGEPNSLKIAFKNISDQPFDSLKAKVTITDRANVTHTLVQQRFKPLLPGDTLQLDVPVNAKTYVGFNSVLVDFNPDNDQPEQYRFNNFLFQNLTVKGDTLNPLLDVTFDNTHILNGDIVSANPDILIKLKDEARFLRLDDTALVKVKIRYPDNTLRDFNFSNDTMRFVPAAIGANVENTATIALNPHFAQDGTYELQVSGQDKSNNKAGGLDYRVSFEVINKPMISNLLNYPNPFTTSTAFVFTLTGSTVPQNIKIQILTVTGKIVREITKEELGPLKVGRNITEFKWDGTDQYGQKLANGVYLYRVVTNLNGKALDKYTATGDDTDKFFNKGYGKMYLMR